MSYLIHNPFLWLNLQSIVLLTPLCNWKIIQGTHPQYHCSHFPSQRPLDSCDFSCQLFLLFFECGKLSISFSGFSAFSSYLKLSLSWHQNIPERTHQWRTSPSQLFTEHREVGISLLCDYSFDPIGWPSTLCSVPSLPRPIVGHYSPSRELPTFPGTSSCDDSPSCSFPSLFFLSSQSLLVLGPQIPRPREWCSTRKELGNDAVWRRGVTYLDEWMDLHFLN